MSLLMGTMSVAAIVHGTAVNDGRRMALSFGLGAARRRNNATTNADEALIRSLYAEYGRMLLGYTYRLTGDRQRAEDVVQETLLRAWRHAGSLSEDRGSVRGWLLTVARNVVIDMARASGVRPVEVGGDERTAASAAVPDQTTNVDNLVVVERALATLSPAHRAVLIEVYMNGLTATEAGQALGIPVGTVKSRTHHALRALRAQLGEIDEVRT